MSSGGCTSCVFSEHTQSLVALLDRSQSRDFIIMPLLAPSLRFGRLVASNWFWGGRAGLHVAKRAFVSGKYPTYVLCLNAQYRRGLLLVNSEAMSDACGLRHQMRSPNSGP